MALQKGTAPPNLEISGAKRNRWLYFGTFASFVNSEDGQKEINAENIKRYVMGKLRITSEKDLAVFQLSCEKVATLIKIGVDSELFNLLNEPDFWLNNVMFREFEFSPRQK